MKTTKLWKIIPFLLLALLCVAAFCVPAAAEDDPTKVYWYPDPFDEGLVVTSDFDAGAMLSTPPTEALEKLVGSCAVSPENNGEYIEMKNFGWLDVGAQTGHAHAYAAAYREVDGDPVTFVLRRPFEKANGETGYHYSAGHGLSALYNAVFLSEKGDRIILCEDFVLPKEGVTISADAALRGFGDKGKTTTNTMRVCPGADLEFDVNGHTIKQVVKAQIFYLFGKGTRFTVFSSRPGAVLSERSIEGNLASYDYLNASVFSWSAGIFNNETENGEFRVGTFEDYPGSNLTLRGGVICNTSPADRESGGLAVFDGLIIHGTVADSSGLFVFRTSTGTVRVCNSDVYITVLGGMNFAPTNRPFVNLQKTAETDADLEKTFEIDNCRIYKNVSGNLVNNVVPKATVKITNTVGNFDLTGSISPGGKILVGEGCAYNVSSGVTFMDGVTEAFNRQKVVCDYTYPDAYAYDPKAEIPFDFGTRNLTLDQYTERGTGKGTVKITWKSLDEKESYDETYVKGGAAAYTGSRIQCENIVTDTYTILIDGWDQPLENLSENMVVRPNVVRKDADVKGLKKSVSFDTGFVMNLYVPYHDEILGAKDGRGGKFSLASTVTLEDKEYFFFRIPVPASAVAGRQTFAITVEMLDDIATQNVTFSVADYAKEALSSETVSAGEKALVRAMMTYGALATRYFTGRTPAALLPYLTDPSESAPVYQKSEAKTLPRNQYFRGVQLNLDANPDFVFALRSGVSGAVKFVYRNASGENVSVTKTIAAGAKNVTLENVGVKNVGADITVTFLPADGGEVAVGVYNLSAYCASQTGDAAALAEALYACYAAAKAN